MNSVRSSTTLNHSKHFNENLFTDNTDFNSKLERFANSPFHVGTDHHGQLATRLFSFAQSKSNKVVTEFNVMMLLISGRDLLNDGVQVRQIIKLARKLGLIQGRNESIQQHPELSKLLTMLFKTIINRSHFDLQDCLNLLRQFQARQAKQLGAHAAGVAKTIEHLAGLIPQIPTRQDVQIASDEGGQPGQVDKEDQALPQEGEGTKADLSNMAESELGTAGDEGQMQPGMDLKDEGSNNGPEGIPAIVSETVSIEQTTTTDLPETQTFVAPIIPEPVPVVETILPAPVQPARRDLIAYLTSKLPVVAKEMRSYEYYFFCLTGKKYRSDAQPIENWLYQLLKSAQGVRAEQLASFKKKLNPESLVAKLGFSNALALLVRGYQMSYQSTPDGTANEKMDARRSASLFKAALLNLEQMYPNECQEFEVENLHFDPLQVSQEFIDALKRKARNESCWRIAKGAALVAFIALGGAYALQHKMNASVVDLKPHLPSNALSDLNDVCPIDLGFNTPSLGSLVNRVTPLLHPQQSFFNSSIPKLIEIEDQYAKEDHESTDVSEKGYLNVSSKLFENTTHPLSNTNDKTTDHPVTDVNDDMVTDADHDDDADSDINIDLPSFDQSNDAQNHLQEQLQATDPQPIQFDEVQNVENPNIDKVQQSVKLPTHTFIPLRDLTKQESISNTFKKFPKIEQQKLNPPSNGYSTMGVIGVVGSGLLATAALVLKAVFSKRKSNESQKAQPAGLNVAVNPLPVNAPAPAPAAAVAAHELPAHPAPAVDIVIPAAAPIALTDESPEDNDGYNMGNLFKTPLPSPRAVAGAGAQEPAAEDESANGAGAVLKTPRARSAKQRQKARAKMHKERQAKPVAPIAASSPKAESLPPPPLDIGILDERVDGDSQPVSPNYAAAAHSPKISPRSEDAVDGVEPSAEPDAVGPGTTPHRDSRPTSPTIIIGTINNNNITVQVTPQRPAPGETTVDAIQDLDDYIDAYNASLNAKTDKPDAAPETTASEMGAAAGAGAGAAVGAGAMAGASDDPVQKPRSDSDDGTSDSASGRSSEPGSDDEPGTPKVKRQKGLDELTYSDDDTNLGPRPLPDPEGFTPQQVPGNGAASNRTPSNLSFVGNLIDIHEKQIAAATPTRTPKLQPAAAGAGVGATAEVGSGDNWRKVAKTPWYNPNPGQQVAEPSPGGTPFVKMVRALLLGKTPNLVSPTPLTNTPATIRGGSNTPPRNGHHKVHSSQLELQELESSVLGIF